MAMAKLAWAGLFCFLSGIAGTAIVCVEAYRTEDAGFVAAPRPAELLCLAGVALSAGSCLFALSKNDSRPLQRMKSSVCVMNSGYAPAPSS